MGEKICITAGEKRIIRTQKYRVKELSDKQEQLFYKTIGACRWYWNTALTDNQWIYQNLHLSIIPRPAEYKNEAPWLKEVDSMALCNSQLTLEKAFKNHFKNPKFFGFPKPKSKKKELNGQRGYTTNNINNNIRIETANSNNQKYSTSIRLPKIGLVPIIYHKPLPKEAIIKNVNISENADGSCYIAVTYATNEPEPESLTSTSSYDVNITKHAIGLDYSSPDLFYDHNGFKPNKTGESQTTCYKTKLPKQEIESLNKKIARANKALSRKEHGSNNYYKQKKKLAKLYAKQKYIREDYQHKLSCEITNRFDFIFVEDLNLKGIASCGGYNLGKATFENAWSGFVDKMSYKAARKGKVLLKVDKFFASTQTCSQCGHKLSGDAKLSLSDRVYHCPKCGAELNRDVNAALNILFEGLRGIISEQVGFEVGLSCVREWWQLTQDDNSNAAEPVGRGGLLVLGNIRPVLSSLIDFARLENLAVLDYDVTDSVSFSSIMGKQEQEKNHFEDKKLTLSVNSS